jgi:hypothetical protein
VNYGWVEYYGLRIERVVVNAPWSFLAAAVRCRHLHLPALVVHRAAAGAFFCVHFGIGNHASHHWSHAGCEQQNKRTELAEKTHHLCQITPQWDFVAIEV